VGAFGARVTISGDTVIVGAPDAVQGTTSSAGAAYASAHVHASVDKGGAYVFVRSGDDWTQQAELLAGDGAADDLFGTAVAVDGDTCLVAATRAGTAGAVYVFVRNSGTWSEQARAALPQPADRAPV